MTHPCLYSYNIGDYIVPICNVSIEPIPVSVLVCIRVRISPYLYLSCVSMSVFVVDRLMLLTINVIWHLQLASLRKYHILYTSNLRCCPIACCSYGWEKYMLLFMIACFNHHKVCGLVMRALYRLSMSMRHMNIIEGESNRTFEGQLLELIIIFIYK